MNQAHDVLKEESLQKGFELRDASARTVALAGLVILLLILGAMLIAWQLYRLSSGESPTRALTTGSWSHDRGQAPLIMEEHARMRRQYEQHLTQYGWVDEERGIARIPIEEAMRIVAQEGLPQWGDPQQRTLMEEIYRNASEH